MGEWICSFAEHAVLVHHKNLSDGLKNQKLSVLIGNQKIFSKKNFFLPKNFKKRDF